MSKKLSSTIFQLTIIFAFIIFNVSSQSSKGTPLPHKFIHHDPIIINSDTDLINLDFPGSGTNDDPYVISNLEISGSGEIGIFITNTTKFVTITNCFINYSSIAIECMNVAPNTISIERNTIKDSSIGVLISHVNYSYIANNEFSHLSNVGIFLQSSFNSYIVNNSINNSNNGIISLYSSQVIIENNTISHGFYGIVASSSLFLNVSMNLLRNNINYAITLDHGTNDSIIYYNDFIDNNPNEPSQAYDDGHNNTWFNLYTIEGNYWSNWVGINAYPIAGNAHTADNHPLRAPVHEWLKTHTFRSSLALYLNITSLLIAFVIIKRRVLKPSFNKLL